MSTTAKKLLGGAAQQLMRGGYNGFSYADLADEFGIRKASIHHHFRSKVDLVVAAVEEVREGIKSQIAALEGGPDAMQRLLMYTGYWERCIADQSAPFCLAGVLASELPSLPPEVAASVRGHFDDLAEWLERVLTLGVAQGTMRLEVSAAEEAKRFMAAVYGAMLVSRVFEDPTRFCVIVDSFVKRIRV